MTPHRCDRSDRLGLAASLATLALLLNPACATPAPKSESSVASAASVATGAGWIAWYRALGRDELHRRVVSFFATQHAPRVDFLPEIAAALHDPDRDVRALAARALGSRPQESAAHADALRAALKDPDEFVRLSAAIALEGVTGSGDESFPTFAALLGSSDPRMRAEAAGWVAGADESGARSVPEIARAFDSEHDAAARRAEASMLAALAKEVPAAAAALRDALDDADPRVRSSALAAQLLSAGIDDEMAKRCVAALADPDAEARRAVAGAVNDQSHEIPDSVRRALRPCQIDPDARVRRNALLALSSPHRGRSTTEWAPTLVAAADPDPEIRELAVGLIDIQHQVGGGLPIDALPALARLIDDPDATPDPRLRAFHPEGPEAPDAPDEPVPVGTKIHVITIGDSIRESAVDALLRYGDDARPYATSISHALAWSAAAPVQTRAVLFFASLGTAARPQREALLALAHQSTDYDYSDGHWASVAAAWTVDTLDGTTDRWPTLLATLAAIEFDPASTSDMHSSWSDRGEAIRPSLLAAAGSDDPRIRAAALHILALIFGAADPVIGERVASAAHDADARVRLVVAGIVANVPDAEQTGFTHDALVELSKDSDEKVRATAERAATDAR